MKNKLLSIISFSVLSLFLSTNLFAQVGINNVDPKARLDISATSITTPINTDGLLIPRVDEFPASPTANQDGMMVYITGAGTPAEGFWYWDGAKWLTIDGGNNWGIKGNVGTSQLTDFIGTTDAQALVFKTDDVERFFMSQNNQFRSTSDGTAAIPNFTWKLDNNTGFYRIGDDILGFSTGAAERMRIASNGNVGINTGATPLGILEVVESGSSQGSIYSHITNTGSNWSAVEAYNPNAAGGAGVFATGYYGVYGSGSSYGVYGIGPTGIRGYGYSGVEGIPVDTVLDWAGYFYGDIGVNNDAYATNHLNWSDERIKSNIEPVSNALEIISKLNPVTYDKNFTVNRKSNGPISSNSKIKQYEDIPTQFDVSVDSEIGLLAQEVKAILPQLVKEKNMNLSNKSIDKLMSINYIGLVPVLIKATQEQQSIIENQNTKIETLEIALERLQEEVSKLQKN